MSILAASKKFGIPYGTLWNHCNDKHIKTTGGQRSLSADFETHLVRSVDLLAEWKVPLDSMDVRMLVKDFLDRRGVTDGRFKNNLPGIDWFKGMDKSAFVSAALLSFA
jgi:hypothetical protein